MGVKKNQKMPPKTGAGEDSPISEDQLLKADFKTSQQARQPNPHYTLRVNRMEGGTYSQSKVELTRAGWLNRKGAYIGDKDNWMVWLTDCFGRNAYVGEMQLMSQLILFIEILSGYTWAPENHIYGQTWPNGKMKGKADVG